MTTEASLVGRLADALADRWRAGEPVPAEHFFDQHPHLWTDPSAALELVAEELAARDAAGLPCTEPELVERFPQWATQVRALLACQRALGGPALPEPGDTLGEFELLSELGRGGHGRVYLASQPNLSGRRVVLKVGPDSGGEHLSLARLQHTHIVPLYSAHDFPERRLRGLCLPDFGGLTLAAVAAKRPASGAELVSLLGSIPGVAAGFLQSASLADAVCWIGACLADALQYAHERGLLHLDVKPSNVLLAADGTPMLLDFHLARPPLAAGDSGKVWVGGTPGHMAPEQDAAVSAVRQGRPVPQPVDGRADLFALGHLLGELADAFGVRLSVGAGDILRRCAAPDPARRYPTAGDVAADLRRHLADRPLAGVRNRSLSERWRKWRRRQPLGLPAAAAVAGLLAAAAGGVAHVRGLADRAAAVAPEADKLLAAGRPGEAADRLRAAVADADGLPFHRPLRTELRTRLVDAERAASAAKLHTVAEQARWVVAGQAPPEQAATVARVCRELWDRRAGLTGAADDLHDIGVAAGAHEPVGEPSTAARFVARGRQRLDANDLVGAAADFDAAVRLDAGSVWANHYRGAVLLRQNRPVEAVAAFTACVLLQPTAGWCRHNRGLAYQTAGQTTAAEADFAAARSLAGSP